MFRLFFRSGVPSNIIPREAIKYDEDKYQITIDLSKMTIPFTKKVKVWIPPIPATGSMRPTFGKGNDNILITPDIVDRKMLADWLEEETLKGNDNVIVYQMFSHFSYGYAIHRVVKVLRDIKGRWFKLRGDKNLRADSYKIRDSNIKSLSIGGLY